MPKVMIQDLKKIQERVRTERVLSEEATRVRVTVHMGTCGIACGAERVYQTLMAEIDRSGVSDVAVTRSGCMGFCAREPLVTVDCHGREPVVYQYVDEATMAEIFTEHIEGGKILPAYALARGL